MKARLKTSPYYLTILHHHRVPAYLFVVSTLEPVCPGRQLCGTCGLSTDTLTCIVGCSNVC